MLEIQCDSKHSFVQKYRQKEGVTCVSLASLGYFFACLPNSATSDGRFPLANMNSRIQKYET